MIRLPLFGLYMWLLVGLVVSSCDTKNSIDPEFKNYFIKYYGEDGSHEAKDFVVNADGSLLIVGTVTLGQTKKIYAVRTDEGGNELRSKTFGSISNETAQAIEPIVTGPDAGNFIILSHPTKSGVDSLAIRLTIVNANLDSLKSFYIDLFESQEGKSITQLQDGDFIISGKVANADTLNAELPGIVDREDLLSIRINAGLNAVVEFQRVGSSSEGANIKLIQSGNFLYIGGYSDELTSGGVGAVEQGSNFFFRSIGPFPTPTLTTIYAGTSTQREELIDLTRSSSGQFFAIGNQTDFANSISSSRVYASRVNGNFSAIDKQGIILNTVAEAVAVAPSSALDIFFLINSIQSSGLRDITMVKMDIDLNEVFKVTFGAPNNDDRGAAVAELPNGDILILGTMELAGQQDKIALIKLRPNGTF